MLTDLEVERLTPADTLRDTISEVGFPQPETSKMRERRSLTLRLHQQVASHSKFIDLQ